MTFNSLRLRLMIGAALAIAVALVVAAFGLIALFDRHVARRIDAELETHLRQLSGSVTFSADGAMRLARPPADPRFGEPFSGLYWQIASPSERLRSRSLWDAELTLAADPLPAGAVHRHEMMGPGGAQLLVRERQVTYPAPDGPQAVRIAVALDRRDLLQAREAFAGDIVPAMVLLAVVLLVAVWLQVSIGLRPLDALRRGIHAVRSGMEKRLGADYPAEVMPLVDEVNDLLAAQDQAIDAARDRAADLAHGLKTPLTVLAADAERLERQGEVEIAGEIVAQVETMRRHVDRELTRARIGTRGRPSRHRTAVRPIVERILRTLRRTPKGETLAWNVSVPEDIEVVLEIDDLVEVLGNVLENGCKWAKHEVSVTAAVADGGIRLTIDDDGSGVPETEIATLGQRGIRLDRATSGTGQGLAIATDIVAAYGGRLAFENRAKGGLRVSVVLPAVTA